MNKEILDYLKGERTCVLSVEMTDGSPHGATLHFAHREEPLTFIFKTFSGSRKCEPLLAKGKTRASVVVGTSEGDMKTFQLDGVAEIIEDESLKSIYLSKFPEKADKTEGPFGTFIIFTPNWWRYSDMTDPEAKLKITSTDRAI